MIGGLSNYVLLARGRGSDRALSDARDLVRRLSVSHLRMGRVEPSGVPAASCILTCRMYGRLRNVPITGVWRSAWRITGKKELKTVS